MAAMSALDLGIVLLLIVSFLGAFAVVGWFLLQRQRRETEQLTLKVRQLQGSVTAVIAGAAGMDRRTARTEQRVLELQRIVDDLQQSRNTTRPYDEAIRLVRQGAGSDRLVQELGLSRSEADLLIMLHSDHKP
jgi:hypothetical protein